MAVHAEGIVCSANIMYARRWFTKHVLGTHYACAKALVVPTKSCWSSIIIWFANAQA